MSIVERALRKQQLGDAGSRPTEPARAAGRGAANVGFTAPAAAEQNARVVPVDLAALRAASLLPASREERVLAQQYRAIKHPILRKALEPAQQGALSKRLVVVTSALPGEGKTFTSVNLALSLALEKDHSTLLVDADIPKPNITRLFGLEDAPGLLDVLEDTQSPVDSLLRSVVVQTDVPGLAILPAGRNKSSAPELLASSRMRDFVECLSVFTPNGIVLFDSAPILMTTEARTLAGLVGQVVIVVKAGETPQLAVQDAIGIIGASDRVSLVLNQAAVSGTLGYYYGYYGHDRSGRA